jgi:multiple antibiotic resistance protein
MEHLITVFVALLTICNPAGALSLFVGMTSDYSPAEKKIAALKTALAVATVLLSVTWAGSHILSAFGVTTSGLEVAGGIIIAMMGLSMLHDKTSAIAHSDNESQAVQEKPSIAVVPMAIPIVAGPGAMTTIILATQKFPGLQEKLGISLICLGISLIIFISLYFAAGIGRILGQSGLSILTKIMGMLLTAIAVQMIASGVVELIPALKA